MLLAIASLLALVACFPAAAPPVDVLRATERADQASAGYAEALADLTANWFGRNTVPGVGVEVEAQVREEPGMKVTVRPARAEEAAWNEWPDGTSRLFNDALGYLWHVRIEGKGMLRWDPSHTSLAVNDSEQLFVPVTSPDDLLGHLLRGARLEHQFGQPPNLSLRLRNADEFRRSYLKTEPAPVLDGVVVFPAPTRTIQVVAMELRLGVVVEGDRLHELHFLFE